jgi:hypothetical protein
MSEPKTNRKDSHPWLSWIVLLVLLIVALGLRWRYIREISLFVDEFVTAWAARNVLSRGLPIFPSGNFYPHGLVFTYLEAPFVAGPFNETLARIPGLLVSLAALPAAYWIGRRLFSVPVGLLAAAAMAVDPDLIVWGGRARMYGLLQLLALLVFYFYYRSLADDRPRDRYLAMGLLVAAVFTHAEAAFLLPVLGLATLVAWPWRRLLRLNVILPFALAAAGVAIFFLIDKYGQQEHLDVILESRPYLTLSANTILSGPQVFAPAFISLHRLPFTLLAVAGLYFVFRPRFDRSSPLTYAYVVLVAFVLLIVLAAGPTWQNERYLFLALPWLFLVGGEVLVRVLRPIPAWNHPGRWSSAFPALLVALYVGLTGAPTAYAQVWGYDQAFRYLEQQQVAPTDRIVTSMSTASMLYLGRDDAFAIQQGYEEYVIDRPGDGLPSDLWTATPVLTTTTAFVDLLTSAPRVWFVADGWRFQTRYNVDFIQTVLEQMDLVYNERGVLIFRGKGYAPLPRPAIEGDRQASFQGEMELTGFGLSTANPSPGQELEITLDWKALAQAGPAYTAFLHLVRPDGTGVAGVDQPVLGNLYQPDLWPESAVLTDRHRLALPPDLAPGRYRLDLGLYRSGQPNSLLAVEGGDHLPLASLTVGQTTVFPPAVRSDVDFGGQVRLLGFDLQIDTTDADQGASITLLWQALQPVDRDYTVFLHLVNGEGTIVAQDDAPPSGPFFPTSTWLPGELVSDLHLLSLPADLPAGDYRLFVGVYYQPAGERLAATDAEGSALGDALLLVTIPLGAQSP